MPNNKRGKLLILGGGLFQTAFIETAVQMGLEVITLDYLPSNPGHRLAHRYINLNFTDVAAVVEAARRERIDGVAVFASDSALPAAAQTAVELGLWAPSVEVVEICVRKDKFRHFQAAKGLPRPRFVSGASWDEAEEEITSWDFPLLLKPADASGSRGILRFDRGSAPDLLEGFAETGRLSRCGVVCAEEYLPGRDLTAEGFLIEGRAERFFLTEKRCQDLVVKGHRVPSAESMEVYWAAKALVEAHWDALGYADGPFDADLRLSEGRLTVLEMSPRLGGNGVPLILDRCWGVNLLEASLNLALRRPVVLKSPRSPRGTASVNLGLPLPGRIVGFKDANEVQRRVPAVAALYSRLEAGMETEAHTHGGNVLAMAVFDCLTAEDYEPMVRKIESALGIEMG